MVAGLWHRRQRHHLKPGFVTAHCYPRVGREPGWEANEMAEPCHRHPAPTPAADFHGPASRSNPSLARLGSPPGPGPSPRPTCPTRLGGRLGLGFGTALRQCCAAAAVVRAVAAVVGRRRALRRRRRARRGRRRGSTFLRRVHDKRQSQQGREMDREKRDEWGADGGCPPGSPRALP